MNGTHWSLFWLAARLIPSGLALSFVPTLAPRLLLSTGAHGAVRLRVLGFVLAGAGYWLGGRSAAAVTEGAGAFKSRHV